LPYRAPVTTSSSLTTCPPRPKTVKMPHNEIKYKPLRRQERRENS
jgi:hypothetical protein